MKMLAFLLKTTDRLVSRMLLNALLFGVLAAGVTVLVGAEATRQWPPQQLTYVAMAIIAGFAAYAASVSVLLGASLHSLVRAAALGTATGTATEAHTAAHVASGVPEVTSTDM